MCNNMDAVSMYRATEMSRALLFLISYLRMPLLCLTLGWKDSVHLEMLPGWYQPSYPGTPRDIEDKEVIRYA